jgi:hypothetical protein
MRKFCIILLILAISPDLIAQKKLPDFGDITLSELQLKSCSFEPEANAMKLFDTGEIDFDLYTGGSRLKTERRVRIKIFNEKGYKQASIRIPYFSKKGIAKIKQLHAIIYNLDASGKITKQELSRKDFFKETAIENVKVVNFTFPGVKPGSVIEYSYTEIENDILQISPWIIQDEIPVLYSSIRIETPVGSRIEKKIWGTDTLEQKIDLIRYDNYRRTTLFKENIVSFNAEPYMSSYKDNLMKVSFMLIPVNNFIYNALTKPEVVWKVSGSNLLHSFRFGEQIKKTIPGTEKIIDSAKSVSSVRDRIIYIYESVKKRIPDKGEQTFYPGDLTEAWNTQSGNTADINLILLNLLKKSDVAAYPLLVSTRDNGKVNIQFPSIGQLNGVDVMAADSNTVYVLDASLKYQSSQNPPFNVINRNGFLLNEENMRWVLIDDDRPLLKENIQIQSQFKDDGTLEGTAYSWYHNYAKSYMLDTTIKEDDKDKQYDKKPQGLTILSITSENADNDSKPLQQTTQFKFEPQQTGDFYFINPQFFSQQKENPFVKDKRNTDIDFGCKQEYSVKFNLSIPATFQVDNLPKNIIVRAPDSSFMFRRIVFSDSEGISVQQTFEIKQSFFYRDEYPGVQEFFKRIYDLMNEEIILKKKK